MRSASLILLMLILEHYAGSSIYYNTTFIQNNITGTGNLISDIIYRSECKLLSLCNTTCCAGTLNNLYCATSQQCKLFEDSVTSNMNAAIISCAAVGVLLLAIIAASLTHYYFFSKPIERSCTNSLKSALYAISCFPVYTLRLLCKPKKKIQPAETPSNYNLKEEVVNQVIILENLNKNYNPKEEEPYQIENQQEVNPTPSPDMKNKKRGGTNQVTPLNQNKSKVNLNNFFNQEPNAPQPLDESESKIANKGEGILNLVQMKSENKLEVKQNTAFGNPTMGVNTVNRSDYLVSRQMRDDNSDKELSQARIDNVSETFKQRENSDKPNNDAYFQENYENFFNLEKNSPKVNRNLIDLFQYECAQPYN